MTLSEQEFKLLIIKKLKKDKGIFTKENKNKMDSLKKANQKDTRKLRKILSLQIRFLSSLRKI